MLIAAHASRARSKAITGRFLGVALMPETVITICLIAMFLIGYVLGRIHGSRWWNDA